MKNFDEENLREEYTPKKHTGLDEAKKLDKKAPQIHIIADYEIPILAIVHQKADDLNLIIKNIRSENDTDADGHKIVDLVIHFAYKSNKFSVDEFVEAISKVDKIYSVSKGKFIKNEKWHRKNLFW